jgi:hypothetical protein
MVSRLPGPTLLRSIPRREGTPSHGLVTFIATYLNVGFDDAFIRQWGKGFIVAWPIAAVTGFLVMPKARDLADRILLRLGRPM